MAVFQRSASALQAPPSMLIAQVDSIEGGTMMERVVRSALPFALAAAALASYAPQAAADNPGTGPSGLAQPDCIGFFRSNPDPGTPVAGGNRQDPGATQGGLHLGDFASQAQPCG
jgi:hypothetical protein